MALAILDRRVQTAPPKAQARDIIGATRIAESCARIADPCARAGLVLGDRATVLAPACLLRRWDSEAVAAEFTWLGWKCAVRHPSCCNTSDTAGVSSTTTATSCETPVVA